MRLAPSVFAPYASRHALCAMRPTFIKEFLSVTLCASYFCAMRSALKKASLFVPRPKLNSRRAQKLFAPCAARPTFMKSTPDRKTHSRKLNRRFFNIYVREADCSLTPHIVEHLEIHNWSYPPASEASRGFYFNQVQKKFTHPYTEYPWVSVTL